VAADADRAAHEREELQAMLAATEGVVAQVSQKSPTESKDK